MGTEEELQELLQLAIDGHISTNYAVYDFEQVNDVLAKLQRFEIKGRVVLRISA